MTAPRDHYSPSDDNISRSTTTIRCSWLTISLDIACSDELGGNETREAQYKKWFGSPWASKVRHNFGGCYIEDTRQPCLSIFGYNLKVGAKEWRGICRALLAHHSLLQRRDAKEDADGPWQRWPGTFEMKCGRVQPAPEKPSPSIFTWLSTLPIFSPIKGGTVVVAVCLESCNLPVGVGVVFLWMQCKVNFGPEHLQTNSVFFLSSEDTHEMLVVLQSIVQCHCWLAYRQRIFVDASDQSLMIFVHSFYGRVLHATIKG